MRLLDRSSLTWEQQYIAFCLSDRKWTPVETLATQIDARLRSANSLSAKLRGVLGISRQELEKILLELCRKGVIEYQYLNLLNSSELVPELYDLVSRLRRGVIGLTLSRGDYRKVYRLRSDPASSDAAGSAESVLIDPDTALVD